MSVIAAKTTDPNRLSIQQRRPDEVRAERLAVWCGPSQPPAPGKPGRVTGTTSVKTKPSQSTVSPTVTSKDRVKPGPSTTKGWNSPFSPQGSTSDGRAANTATPYHRPASSRGA